MTALLLAALFAQESFEKRLDDLHPRLASYDFRVRESASLELNTLVDAAGPTVRRVLKSRLQSASDPMVKAALRAALARLPVLQLSIKVEGEAAVGKPMAFRIRITNVSDEDVAVVGALDGSDAGLRFPFYGVEITRPDGSPWVPVGELRCGNCNALRTEDIVRLKPGDEFDPLGEGFFRNYRLSIWRPATKGKHLLRMIVSFSSEDPEKWNGPMKPRLPDPHRIRSLLADVPKINLEAKVEFEVK
ncbi:MAG TPA: hypothetical protein VFC86_12610 [Planctomycetota bacterium]|nr:hypothetical protein [Planctomycetota bacterium]